MRKKYLNKIFVEVGRKIENESKFLLNDFSDKYF